MDTQDGYLEGRHSEYDHPHQTEVFDTHIIRGNVFIFLSFIEEHSPVLPI